MLDQDLFVVETSMALAQLFIFVHSVDAMIGSCFSHQSWSLTDLVHILNC